eukprot:212200-Prorocentrum_minimum.AAC.1
MRPNLQASTPQRPAPPPGNHLTLYYNGTPRATDRAAVREGGAVRGDVPRLWHHRGGAAAHRHQVPLPQDGPVPADRARGGGAAARHGGETARAARGALRAEDLGARLRYVL